MAFELFDYVDLRQRNVPADWLLLVERDLRGRLKAKLYSIKTFGGPGLPGMVTDTTERHIKEIVVNGKQALRMFLCRGPGDGRTQITLLGGGRELDTKYVTRGEHVTPAAAEERRKILFADPHSRRKTHEFPEDNLG